MLERTCNKCGEVKPATTEFFNSHPECRDGLRPECRECHKSRMRTYYLANSAERRAKTAEYAAANVDKVREYRTRYRANRREALAAMDRAATLKREYGLTPEQYMDLFERQGGRCAICKATITKAARLEDSYARHAIRHWDASGIMKLG